jgi:two-component system response regulator AtoC
LNIPPLRERKEDIPFLADHFSRKFGGQLSDAAIDRLMGYHWPGNVRELENVIERSILLAPHPRVEADDVRIEMGQRSRAAVEGDHFLPDGLTLDQYEQSIIREAMKRAQNNKSQAARLLGLTRNALRYRLAQMGLE